MFLRTHIKSQMWWCVVGVLALGKLWKWILRTSLIGEYQANETILVSEHKMDST